METEKHPDIELYNQAFEYLIQCDKLENLIPFKEIYKEELEIIKTHPALIFQLRQIYQWKYRSFLEISI